MSFKVGEQVLLKVCPVKGFMRFDKKGKLNPWYIGLFKMGLSGFHLVFHTSILKMYHGDLYYIIKWESILFDKDLNYNEESVVILD